jgi:hypothetical protein
MGEWYYLLVQQLLQEYLPTRVNNVLNYAVSKAVFTSV